MYGYQSVTINSGAAAGNDGSATSNGTSSLPVCGEICSIGITYGDSPPSGTTDVTIETTGTHGPALTLLTITDGATNGWYHVRHKIADSAGADITYDGTRDVYEKVCISDYVKVTIAQANSPDTAEVVINYYG